jgi:hypothetical protein
MKTDTGTEMVTSIGNESIAIPPLASDTKKAEKPLQAAPMKPVNKDTLMQLAELLSLLQEDCRRYKELLAPYLTSLPVFMNFDTDAIIFIAAPPGHTLGFNKGHIQLDDQPVTGWGYSHSTLTADTDETLTADTDSALTKE